MLLSSSRNRRSNEGILRNEKDLLRVGILHFGSRRETFNIDVLTGRIGTFNQVRFARDWNSVGIISLGRLGGCSGGCRSRRRAFRGGSGRLRLRRTIGIEWLLLRRILRRLALGGILRDAMFNICRGLINRVTR